MHLSKVGKKFSKKSSIQQLMGDIALALNEGGYTDLSAGNPVIIPEVAKLWREKTKELMENEDEFDKQVAKYGDGKGYLPFRKAVASLFKRRYDWDINEDNIVVTNGTQTAYFHIFNCLAGTNEKGVKQKIIFPVLAEYFGYTVQGLEKGIFESFIPEIEEIGKHEFKYHPDFKKIKIKDNTRALCVSRPTNPTGNVVTDEEVEKLNKLCKEHETPLVLDAAYSAPIPNLCFTEMIPYWDENIIYTMSLSKAGLAGCRIGVVIAREEIAKLIGGINYDAGLDASHFGQAVSYRAIDSGELEKLSDEVINPYYKNKSELARKIIKENFKDSIPYYIHKSEGCIFLWAWFKDLPISDKELYEKLKERKVIVVPGNPFFPGQEDAAWKHKNECIRISLTASDEDLEKGLRVIGETVGEVYE